MNMWTGMERKSSIFSTVIVPLLLLFYPHMLPSFYQLVKLSKRTQNGRSLLLNKSIYKGVLEIEVKFDKKKNSAFTYR